MSVYRDSNATVTFEHPFPGPLVATVYRGETQIMGPVAVASESRGPNKPYNHSFELTYKETQFDGPLDIRWSGDDGGQTFLRTTTEQVITPLVPLSRLRTVFKETNWTDTEIMELENTIRVFIESYTGQSFGYELATHYVTGTGEKRVALPKRLIRATAISGGPAQFFSPSTDGWYLYIGNKNYLHTKEAPPEEFGDNPTYMTKGVIHVPDTYWNRFRVGARYAITGEWGYHTVPEDIQEAILLLANDWGCGDVIYRDRYLEAVKFADSNMTYNQGAYRATGNARVDQLLDKYRRQGMVII